MKFDPKFMNRLTEAAEYSQYNQAIPGYRSGGEILQGDKSVPFAGPDGHQYMLERDGSVISK